MLSNGTQHSFHPPSLYHRLCARHKLEARDTSHRAGGAQASQRLQSSGEASDCSPGFRRAVGTLCVPHPPHLSDNSWSPGSGSPLVLMPSEEQGLVSVCPGKWGNSLTQWQKSLCGYVPPGSYQPSQVWLPGLYSQVRATLSSCKRAGPGPRCGPAADAEELGGGRGLGHKRASQW